MNPCPQNRESMTYWLCPSLYLGPWPTQPLLSGHGVPSRIRVLIDTMRPVTSCDRAGSSTLTVLASAATRPSVRSGSLVGIGADSDGG
jgi:hypothetical protein